MWPTCRIDRARLAAYLVFDAQVDVMGALETMEGGWQLTVSNGIVRTSGGHLFEATLAGTAPATVPPLTLTMLALHLLWISFPPAVLAAFIQSKHMLCEHKSPFWASLFSSVAWIIAAPAPITTALHIGRPDVSGLVSALYTEWLCLCRSPAIVETQLAAVLIPCWDYTTYTAEWEHVQTWIVRAGIMCARPHTSAAASISLNGAPCLALSKRDKVLLVLVQLFCDPLQWSANEPPHTAPTAFRDLSKLLTADTHHPSPVDDLYPVNQYTSRDFA
jgi:hypothetical protein